MTFTDYFQYALFIFISNLIKTYADFNIIGLDFKIGVLSCFEL